MVIYLPSGAKSVKHVEMVRKEIPKLSDRSTPSLLDELREMDVPDNDAPNSAGNANQCKGESV